MPCPRPVLARARLALVQALACAPACDRTHGEVELNWTVVDAAGAQVFPNINQGLGDSKLKDLCNFTGRTEESAAPRDYSLHVELRLCEPGCECSDPACQAERLRYACNAARGYDTVAVGEYNFTVALVAELGQCDCELTSACALVPGPRTRAVEPGLVTDLQVYLFVLTGYHRGEQDQGRDLMDLTGCCLPDPSCSP